MSTLSEEHKFHLIFAQGRKFLGTRVPGSESTWEQKFQLPILCTNGTWSNQIPCWCSFPWRQADKTCDWL